MAMAIKQAIAEAQQTADNEHKIESTSINCVLEEEPLIGATLEKVSVKVAMDSAAVDNVIHPKALPGDAEPVPNTDGRHFVGANNTRIERYGSVDTK